MDKLHALLGTLLVLSIALHVILQATGPVAVVENSPRLRTQHQSALTTSEAQHQPRQPSTVSRPERHPKKLPSGTNHELTGSRAQAEALCARAQRTMDEDWRKRRETIADDLKASLSDPQKEAREATQTAHKMARALNLDEPSTGALEQDYAKIRRAHVHEALEALATDPPDYEAVFDAAKDLFEDEDALIRDYAGPNGVARWRLAELESRTTILALLASLADLPWNDELVW